MAYSDNVPVANLTRRTSKAGNDYFSGRLGAARVVLLKDRDPDQEGREVWTLMFQAGDDPPWHPGRDGRKSPMEGARSAQDAPTASGESRTGNSGDGYQRAGYGGRDSGNRRSGGMRPAGEALAAAMEAQAPHSGGR